MPNVLKVRLKYFACLFFFLCQLSIGAFGQNIHKADSFLLELDELGKESNEYLEMLVKISTSHPNAIVGLQYAQQALSLSQERNQVMFEAKALEGVAVNQRLLGNYSASLEASLEALRLFKELGEYDLTTAILDQLGVNASIDKNFEEATDYFHQAKAIYKVNNNLLLHALTNINLGEAHRSNSQLDSATIYFNKALLLNKTLNNPTIQAYAVGNLGMVYNTQNRLSEARINLTTAIEEVEKLGDPYTGSVYLAELGLVNQKEGKWRTAEIDMKEALSLAETHHLKEQVRDVCNILVDLYKESGQHKEALVYQEQFQIYQDSLVNKVGVQKTEQLKANFEINQRETEIAYLSAINDSQERQNYALAFATVVSLGFIFLLYRGNRQKLKSNIILTEQRDIITRREEEKALLLKELNHRVKNNLQMVSSLMNLHGYELKDHPAGPAIESGKRRVDALALIHQKLYKEEFHTEIDLKEFIEDLVLNLCYSFGDKVEPSMSIPNINIAIDKAIPLSLIINELVTNSLKYAFEENEVPKLTVSLLDEQSNFSLTLHDNGPGFDLGNIENYSFGIKLVHSLTAQLKGTIDLDNDQGTTWSLTFPKE